MPIYRITKGQLFLGLWFTIFLFANGALAGEIAGTVSEAGSDLTLPEVSISLEGMGLIRDVQTGIDGDYRIADLPAGQYRLEFSAFGYLDLVREIDLVQDEKRSLDVALELDAVELDDVLVVGKTTDIENDLQTGFVNLDAKTLDSIPGIVEPDPLRALQILPGVQAASDISSGLYIRGGGPDQNLVLMDGVTVYNPTHAFGFFSTFSNDVVDNVSLYKGAYPAEYGGRLGAVLDVGMKKPEAQRVEGKAGISFISARVYLEGSLGQDHWLVSGRRSYLEPILSAVRTDIARQGGVTGPHAAGTAAAARVVDTGSRGRRRAASLRENNDRTAIHCA